MLLPDRRTIRPLLEEQKRQTAKEGLALANKVDALRQEYNDLKKNREEFIAGTILEVEKAVKLKWGELKLLEGQVEVLEERKRQLSINIHAAIDKIGTLDK